VPDKIGEIGSLIGAYAEMAADQQREREAEEWSDALISDADKSVPS